METIKTTKAFRFFALFLITVMLTGSFASCKKKEVEEITTTTSAPTTVTTTEAPRIINPLTGMPGYNKALVNNRPIIISVENHPDARPQWGLCSSDIVMEMVAEGGITRMLLMYADKTGIPEKVGPVRSARHYFVELTAGFDAILIHCGGSTYAYDEFNKGYCDHIDHMAVNSCFTRDKSRNVAYEHTLFTTGSEVVQTIKDMEYREKLNDGYEKPFLFYKKATKLSKENVCTKCSVSFSSAYNYSYNYYDDEKLYYSSINGKPFCDSDGNQQNFTNLIFIYTTITDLNDSKNRVTFDLNSGHGVYISNGTYRDITWVKGSETDMLKFYDEDGNDLKLNPGRSYIGIIGSNREGLTQIS